MQLTFTASRGLWRGRYREPPPPARPSVSVTSRVTGAAFQNKVRLQPAWTKVSGVNGSETTASGGGQQPEDGFGQGSAPVGCESA